VAYGTQTTYSFPIQKAWSPPGGKIIYVSGRATDSTLDRDGQRISEQWARSALRDWLGEGGSLRLSHDPRRPIGKGIEIGPDGLTVRSAVVDKQARRLVLAKCLRAYSVGVSRPVITPDPSAPGGLITGGVLTELSLTDTPSNPSCGVVLCKSAAGARAQWVGKPFVVLKGKKHKHDDAPLIMCTKCGTQLDAGERFCTGCGKRNPHYLPLADAKIPMNKKGARVSKKRQRKARKILKAYQRVDILTKAAGAPPSHPIYSEGQAVRFMIASFLDDPGSQWRLAAEEALARL
jgi:hypothetical protein